MWIKSQILGMPFGSYDFTPEGYAKVSHWVPEDSASNKGFSFDTNEELEAKLAEIERNNANKLRIVDDHYLERSLRTIMPNRWLVSYTRDKAWQEVNGQKVPLYTRLKRKLLFKSTILGYGEGPIQNVLSNNDEAVRYIRENCASSVRLKAIALRAYESVERVMGHHTWAPVSPPIFLCLAAAKSSLDAMASVLWALLFHKVPKRAPSMATLCGDLKGHAFLEEFAKLHESAWFTKLQFARDSVIHRSASIVIHDKFGAAFDSDLGEFEDRPAGFHAGKPRVDVEEGMTLLHLEEVMKGFVAELEKWEVEVARKLQELSWFASLNTDGVLIGIEFNDDNLLRDGSGASLVIKSRS